MAIVTGVVRRNAAINFKRAEQVPLEGLPDPTVLGLAAEEARILVSHDATTMPSHFRDFVQKHASPGLILIPQELNIGAAIEALLLICDACEPPDLDNAICLLPSLSILRF